MTLSVPYSFVPGTKAKADEVNANFIAVLDKIGQTNSDIETINNTKMNADLSNLDESGRNTLDKIIDGSWTSKAHFILQNVTLSKTYEKTFDLSGYLPDDGNVYEVIFSGTIRTGAGIHNALGIYVKSTLCSSIYLCRAVTRVANANQIASGNCIIPIAADRQLTIFAGDETNASSFANSCSFRVSGYRKVR